MKSAVCPSSSRADSPVSDSGDTLILHDDDDDLPTEWIQKESNSLSFLHLIPFDAQSTEPQTGITKESIYEALTAKASILVPNSVTGDRIELSGLEPRTSLSSFITPEYTSANLVLPGGKLHVIDLNETVNCTQFAENWTVSKGCAPCMSQVLPATSSLIAPLEPNDFARPVLLPSNNVLPKSAAGAHQLPPITVLRTKNREAARKCRQKKKTYIQQLEKDFKDLKEKYTACCQENDDLKRLLLQHFNITLPSKRQITGFTDIACKLPTPSESFKNLHIRDEFGIMPAMYIGLAGNKFLPNESFVSDDTKASGPQYRSELFPHPAAEAETRRGCEAMHLQNMRVLQATQGQHAPLRLAMEQKIIERMTPRQPSLFSHHVLAAQLNGTLDTIDFCDILNNPEDAETIGRPLLLLEHQHGIL